MTRVPAFTLPILLCALACAGFTSRRPVYVIHDLHGLRCCCPCSVAVIGSAGDTLDAHTFSNEDEYERWDQSLIPENAVRLNRPYDDAKIARLARVWKAQRRRTHLRDAARADSTREGK